MTEGAWRRDACGCVRDERDGAAGPDESCANGMRGGSGEENATWQRVWGVPSSSDVTQRCMLAARTWECRHGFARGW